MNELTAERLRELLHYDQETGVFTWLVARGSVKAGRPTGCAANSHGYSVIRVDRVMHGAHRLAWLYVHKSWPTEQIDHINGDRADNRIVNLREVTQRVNLQNHRKAARASSTGFLGVTYNKRERKFVVQITVNYQNRRVGRFDTLEEAHAAYVAAKRRLHQGCTI